METRKLRFIIPMFYILLTASVSGCGDSNTTVDSLHDVNVAVGGVVYVGDLVGDNVTITISDVESSQWTTASNSNGLWRIDGEFEPGTYDIEYSTTELPILEKTFTVAPNDYSYSNSDYNYIENDYMYLGQVNLTEQVLQASISPFLLTLENYQEHHDVAGGKIIQFSHSTDSDIVITFNYPLWSVGDICLLDSSEVPLFKDTDGDGLGDYPLCATFNAFTSTFTFTRSELDQAYLGVESSGFVGTSTMTGLIADNALSTHYLLWVGVKVVDDSFGFYFDEYGEGANMLAFTPQFGTESFLQGKIYFNVIP